MPQPGKPRLNASASEPTVPCKPNPHPFKESDPPRRHVPGPRSSDQEDEQMDSTATKKRNHDGPETDIEPKRQSSDSRSSRSFLSQSSSTSNDETGSLFNASGIMSNANYSSTIESALEASHNDTIISQSPPRSSSTPVPGDQDLQPTQHDNASDDFRVQNEERRRRKHQHQRETMPLRTAQRVPRNLQPRPRTDRLPLHPRTVLIRPSKPQLSVQGLSDSLLEAVFPSMGKIQGRRTIRGGGIALDFDSSASPDELLQPTCISGIPVRCSAPVPTPCKAGLIGGILLHYSNEQIVEIINKDSANTTSARRAQRLGSRDAPSETVKIIFNSATIPKELFFHSATHPVAPYADRTVQCRQCLRLHHQAFQCSGPLRCSRCSGPHSYDASCAVPPKCANCKGDHQANDPSCPRLLRSRQVNNLKARDNCTLSEARSRISARSYASAARSQQFPEGQHSRSNSSRTTHKPAPKKPKQPSPPRNLHFDNPTPLSQQPSSQPRFRPPQAPPTRPRQNNSNCQTTHPEADTRQLLPPPPPAQPSAPASGLANLANVAQQLVLLLSANPQPDQLSADITAQIVALLAACATCLLSASYNNSLHSSSSTKNG